MIYPEYVKAYISAYLICNFPVLDHLAFVTYISLIWGHKDYIASGQLLQKEALLPGERKLQIIFLGVGNKLYCSSDCTNENGTVPILGQQETLLLVGIYKVSQAAAPLNSYSAGLSVSSGRG